MSERYPAAAPMNDSQIEDANTIQRLEDLIAHLLKVVGNLPRDDAIFVYEMRQQSEMRDGIGIRRALLTLSDIQVLRLEELHRTFTKENKITAGMTP